MKVLHVIPSLSPEDGGPSFALPIITRGLTTTGIHVDVATTEVPGIPCVNTEGLNIFSFPRQSNFYKVSFPLSKWLTSHITDYDLVHIHALFSYSSYSAAKLAKRNHIPYIVRPLGVLNRWGMQNRRRSLKKLSFRLIEKRIINHSAAIHFTSQQERIEAEETVGTIQAAVIPLGIDLAPYRPLSDPDRFYERFPNARGRDIILFLSRLDQKKGLDLLLGAFAEVDRRRTTEDRRPASEDRQTIGPLSSVAGPPSPIVGRPLLVIAGNGENHFVEDLQGLATQLNVAGDILWAGFLEGADKLSALTAASLFVLPSYSENFGIALVEAMAAGLPCVISDQVGIASDAQEYDAGLVVPCEVRPLAAAIQRLLDDPELRTCLGTNARRLVDDRFSVESMSNALVKLYDRVLSRETVGRRQTSAAHGPENAPRPASVK